MNFQFTHAYLRLLAEKCSQWRQDWKAIILCIWVSNECYVVLEITEMIGKLLTKLLWNF